MAGRRAKRLRSTQEITVAFQGPTDTFSAELVDISRTGILLRCPQDLELGSMGRIAISLGPETFRSVAAVRRRNPSVGLALEFIQMSPHDRDVLHRLLLQVEHLAKP